MVFKTTSTEITPRHRRRGMTLVEAVVAMGLGSILIVVIASLTFYSSRSFAAMANYADLEYKSRSALDRMTRDIRQVKALKTWTTNQLVFEDWDGSELSFSYNKDERTLRRVRNGVSQILLIECDELAFRIFKRNPIAGNYDQYPTADASTCKLVQLNWTCSRQIFGQKVNTESVQTAKIVIRKQ